MLLDLNVQRRWKVSITPFIKNQPNEYLSFINKLSWQLVTQFFFVL
jgi:hypothetical protein